MTRHQTAQKCGSMTSMYLHILFPCGVNFQILFMIIVFDNSYLSKQYLLSLDWFIHFRGHVFILKKIPSYTIQTHLKRDTLIQCSHARIQRGGQGVRTPPLEFEKFTLLALLLLCLHHFGSLVQWSSHLPCKRGNTSSIMGFFSLADEILNLAPISI